MGRPTDEQMHRCILINLINFVFLFVFCYIIRITLKTTISLKCIYLLYVNKNNKNNLS